MPGKTLKLKCKQCDRECYKSSDYKKVVSDIEKMSDKVPSIYAFVKMPPSIRFFKVI